MTESQLDPEQLRAVIARELAGAPDGAIGRSIRLDGASCTVVGVMPASFAFPDRETRAWQPFVVRAVTEPNKPGRYVSLFQAIVKNNQATNLHRLGPVKRSR